MENYVPSDQEEVVETSPPFPFHFTENVMVMKIKKNSKFGGILDHVRKHFDQVETTRHIIFEGIGDAADKCISCVEVFKRQAQIDLYQWNALQTAKRIIFWDPIIEGLERLKVTIDTPVMYILISKDPFPLENQCLSMQCTSSKSETAPAEKNPQKKGNQRAGRQNKWVRPDKENIHALVKEREEVVNSIRADP